MNCLRDRPRALATSSAVLSYFPQRSCMDFVFIFYTESAFDRMDSGSSEATPRELEGGFDSTGQFYHLPVHDTDGLAECLRQRTIGPFLKLADPAGLH